MTIAGRVREEVARVLAPVPHAILAVSGGLDSMTLLDAVAHTLPDRVATVAVFDHRTGPAARRAVEHVRSAAGRLGLAVTVGRSPRGLPPREAAWRKARWQFLRQVAERHNATVVTAHTRDDHIETVFMRALRDSGARGLAALHATSGIARPLLAFTRCDVESYARACAIEWIEDPSNASLAYARNRARLELLPALERAQPGFGEWLLSVSARAWALRREVDGWIDANVPHTVGHGCASHAEGDGPTLEIARRWLAPYDDRALRVLWPALAARLGLALDRRGTERLATFTITGRAGARIQLSGGFEAVRMGELMVLRRGTANRHGG